MSTNIRARVSDAVGGDAVRKLAATKGYSVVEESVPVDVSDTTGSTGKVTVGIGVGGLTGPAAKRLYRKNLRLDDADQGSVRGIIRTPSYSNGEMSLSVDMRLTALATTMDAVPYQGSLTGYLEYLLGLGSIADDIDIDSSYDAIDVVIQGWSADGWLMLKALCATYGMDVSEIQGVVTIRPARGVKASIRRDGDLSWSVDDSSLAKRVEGYWYENTWHSSALAYPPGGWNDQVQILQVGAREVQEVELDIDASLISVVQPTCVDFVGRYYDATSVYAVARNDGLPIPAAQWLAAGGSVTVELGEGGTSLVVTVTGAGIEQYAPFQIAMSAGPSDTYSSLRIVGEGAFTRRHYAAWDTGAPEDTTTDIGATIDIPFLTTYELFSDALARACRTYSGPKQALSVRAGSVASADFAGQTFGNVAGARVLRDGHWFRIRQATIEPAATSYTAEVDTTADDFNDWADSQGWVTIDDVNAAFDEMTFDDINAAPLVGGL